jgi:hypothetical protein
VDTGTKYVEPKPTSCVWPGCRLSRQSKQRSKTEEDLREKRRKGRLGQTQGVGGRCAAFNPLGTRGAGNWDSPPPPTRRLVCPLPPVSGGRGTLPGEKGVGRVPIPTRGIHCGTLYMYVLCGYRYRSMFCAGILKQSVGLWGLETELE